VRTFVIGDPQATFDKVLDVLDRHGALATGDEPHLAADVRLISIGDHFDYDLQDPLTAGQEGIRVLRWLASHAPEQVILLAGNHDLSRVMELATIRDDEFATARDLARAIDDAERRDATRAAAAAARAEFAARFPTLPAPGVVGRDYASFSSEQRTLVMQLLLAGRFHLALAGVLVDGREVLITHAGVTGRELGILGIRDVSPRTIAAVLEGELLAAVDRVRDDWQRGELAPLCLEPLHVAGRNGVEGGGMLYHRPSNPDRPDADKAWELDPSRPRRFDPRTLPPITQLVGHSGHAKCVYELGPWVTANAQSRKHGGIRTLRVDGGQVTYDLGVAAPPVAAPTDRRVADVIMIDGELRRVPADEFALLEVQTVELPPQPREVPARTVDIAVE
jgi:hypothetical protein